MLAWERDIAPFNALPTYEQIQLPELRLFGEKWPVPAGRRPCC